MRPNQQLLSLLLSLSMWASISAQVDVASIQQLLDSTATANDIPAVSVGIVFNNQTYFFNFGKHNRTNNKVVDENSIYQIASVGKPLVGIICQEMILSGQLDPEQPITDFLPGPLRTKRRELLKKVTIRNLLQHSSGLPQDARAAYRRKDGTAYDYDYQEGDFYHDLNKIKIRPVGKYQYSNFGYALLSHILTKVSGMSYQALLDQYIGQEVGWQITSTTLAPNLASSLVTPYRKDKRNVATQVWRMGLFAPPSGVYSCTAELLQLMQQQLAAYQDFLQKGTVTRWILSNYLIKKGVIRYGFGINAYGGGYYGHSGDMDGYAADYSFNTKYNFGIVLLTSSGEDWINPMIRRINRMLEATVQ